MNAMPALAALAAAPTRGAAAPADGAGAEGTDATGGFAGALELARDPRAGAKAAGKSDLRFGTTVCHAPVVAPQAATDADKEAGPAQASIDATMPPEDTERAAALAPPDLTALLPGWPMAPTAAAAASSEARTAVATVATETVAATVMPAVVSGIAKNAFEVADKTRPAPTTPAGKRRDEGHEGREARVPPNAPPLANANVPAAVAKAPAQGQPAVAMEPALAAAPTRPVQAAASMQPLQAGNDNLEPKLAVTMPIVMAPGQAAAPALAATNSVPPTFEARLNARLDSPSFAPALAHQVTWLVNEGVQQARLALNPAEMGPVMVRIVLDGSQARIDFSADLPATRAAIEASLPNLAASLHDHGLTLAGGGVSDGHQARQGTPERQAAQAHGHNTRTNETTIDAPAMPTAATRSTRGLVDLVA